MSVVTKFGVLPIFRDLGGKLAPLRAISVFSADEAKRKAEVFALVVGGAVAFSRREGNPTQILRCCGEVPEGLRASRNADTPELGIA